jgi:hypothetical protein
VLLFGWMVEVKQGKKFEVLVRDDCSGRWVLGGESDGRKMIQVVGCSEFYACPYIIKRQTSVVYTRKRP